MLAKIKEILGQNDEKNGFNLLVSLNDIKICGEGIILFIDPFSLDTDKILKKIFSGFERYMLAIRGMSEKDSLNIFPISSHLIAKIVASIYKSALQDLHLSDRDIHFAFNSTFSAVEFMIKNHENDVDDEKNLEIESFSVNELDENEINRDNFENILETWLLKRSNLLFDGEKNLENIVSVRQNSIGDPVLNQNPSDKENEGNFLKEAVDFSEKYKIRDISSNSSLNPSVISPRINKSPNADNKEKSSFQRSQRNHIPGVKKVFIVISGKGGVGKSTLSLLLSYILEKMKKKVALVDADIHGPSLSRMLGINDEPIVKDNVFIPPNKGNIKMMSSALFNQKGDALIWRGPMISKMLHQLLYNSEWRWSRVFGWRESDFMIIDTPPGTGDIHLSLINNYHIDGAIIVSTEQLVSLDAVDKSVQMLKKLGINVVGIVENSMLDAEEVVDKRGNIHLNKNGIDRDLSCLNGKSIGNDTNNSELVKNYAIKWDVEYLGCIPYSPSIWKNLDMGNSPFLKSNGDEKIKKIIDLLQILADKLDKQ